MNPINTTPPSSSSVWSRFLKDVFICSLGAYGGPEAHFGVFTDQLVQKKKYLTEEELAELIALTGILPGPSSTQTIVAIGYKTGGPILAFLTFLVWALPVLSIMTLLSFLGVFLSKLHVSQGILRFIGPMAVGFIVSAAYRIGRKMIKNWMTLALFFFGGLLTYFIRQPWIYPLVLICGGITSILSSKEKNLWNKIEIRPPWKYLIAFSVIALGSLLLSSLWNNRLVHLFESFYRYGYLVIGGGQVVVPMMFSELVELNKYMTSQEFLTGFGLVQGLPGPMFSFSAYAGGLAARGGSAFYQVLGAALSGIAIFLPGVLLIYFIYPIWENLKQIKGIRVSLTGITAVASGLIAASAIILMQKTGFALNNIIVVVVALLLLLSKKVPAPLIVLLTIAAGFLVP